MWAIFLLGGKPLFKGQQLLGLYALLDPNNLHLHSPSFFSYFTPCTDNSFEPANKRSLKLTLLPLLLYALY